MLSFEHLFYTHLLIFITCCTYQMVDNVTARGTATTITEPLPGCGAENDTRWVVYTAVGTGMWWQVLAIKLIILIILKRQLANCTCCRLDDTVQSVCQHIWIFCLQSCNRQIYKEVTYLCPLPTFKHDPHSVYQPSVTLSLGDRALSVTVPHLRAWNWLPRELKQLSCTWLSGVNLRYSCFSNQTVCMTAEKNFVMHQWP